MVQFQNLGIFGVGHRYGLTKILQHDVQLSSTIRTLPYKVTIVVQKCLQLIGLFLIVIHIKIYLPNTIFQNIKTKQKTIPPLKIHKLQQIGQKIIKQRIMQQRHKPPKLPRTSKVFENSWSVSYQKPTYDALADPHSSFYFLNRSMKKHLVKMKKSIEKEGRYGEKKRISFLINERLRDRANSIAHSKGEVYDKYLKSDSSASSIHKSTDSLTSFTFRQNKKRQPPRKLKIQKLSTEEQDLLLPSITNDKKKPQINIEKLQKKHENAHNQFLKFLTTKKQGIELLQK